MIEVGYFSFCFALFLSLYAFATGVICLFKPYVTLVNSSKNAIIGIFLCLFLSAAILWNSIFFHDFSVRYVYLNSAADMPPVYLFTSFWSALEGSHFLWTLLMSLICAISVCTVRKNNFVYYPSLCVVYSVALTFMLILSITVSAPLTRMFPVGQLGRGMNALLQNPYMAIHPPMLFTGYSLLIVPFAYSFAALIRGYFTNDCFITIRRSSLISWAFLTIAIFLGGKWAYYELGWGGYWGWDPVENSSFMPWLALTAAIHTFLIYTKTKRLPRLALFLTMLGFVLSFQGTFITRSNIISSVHSFAQSSIGPAYLTWILFLFSTILILIFTRGYAIEGAAKINEWKFSKETVLLFALFLFLFFLALVFVGTLLPLVVEALKGIKISIQQPFFNAFIPWIGLGFVSILGIGNLLRWRSGRFEDPISCLLFPAIWSLALTASICYQKNLNMKTAACYFLIFWTSFILIMDLVFKLKEINWNGIAFLKNKRSYLGAMIVHLGFLMSLLGFTGNLEVSTVEVNLNLNQSTNFHGYKITNEGLDFSAQYNQKTIGAKLSAFNHQTNESVIITPTRSKFTNNENWFNEIGVYSTFWHDIYVVLSSFDIKTEAVSLRISINPTVKFVWTSLVVSIFGIIVALSHSLSIPRKRFAKFFPLKKNRPPSKKVHIIHKFSCVGIILIAFLSLCFAYSGMVFAQEKMLQKDEVPIKMNSQLEDIAKELRCPTCLGMSIIESQTPQSQAMRAEIIEELNQGKSKREIIDYFKSRYGDWILREPDFHSSYGFLIWIIPILGLVAGPLFILIGVKTSNKRKMKHKQFIINQVNEYIDSMRSNQKQ